MKIKIVNAFKLKNPPKNILDVEIIEGNNLSKGKKFINSENNLEFIIDSVGQVNPSTSIYYPLLVTTNNSDLEKFRDKIFLME